MLSGNFEAIKFAVELADKIDEATAKTIQRAVNQASKEGQRKVNVVVRTAADESNPVVFTYKTLPPPTWKEVPLTEKKIPSRAAPSKFDRNTILNDSDFDVSNTLSQEKIQELFEKRNSFFKDYIDPTTRKPASWVIADRARHYRISSKILLAKMQAESSSIWNAEMSRKMMERDCYYQGRNIGKGVDWVLGFGWTDAGPIPKYKGFYNQVDGAARLLSVAFAQPEAFTDAKGLKWSVGESHTVFDGTVTPRNRATIALYVYTPSIKANKLFYNVWQMMFGSKLIVQEVTKLKEGLITALIIDKSGSMRGEKIKKAKTAAYIYVDTSQPERDSISLVAFSSNAQSITEPISINQGKEVLKRDILSVDAGGNTNIGSGLTVALSHLSSSDFEDKRAILMSDGRHNTGTYRPEVAEFQRRGWPIYTVAFGADADQETLRWIAEQTGGSFFPAGLSNLGFVYHKIRVLAHNGSVYRSYNDFMRTGQELIYDVPINPDMKRVGFFTNWQGSRMETVLFSPDKTVINRSNVNKFGRFIEGKTYNCFEINN
ncbi:MAG: VWA domain-containing protein, partial [Candidatus Aminicenantales bacterium]